MVPCSAGFTWYLTTGFVLPLRMNGTKAGCYQSARPVVRLVVTGFIHAQQHATNSRNGSTTDRTSANYYYNDGIASSSQGLRRG